MSLPITLYILPQISVLNYIDYEECEQQNLEFLNVHSDILGLLADKFHAQKWNINYVLPTTFSNLTTILVNCNNFDCKPMVSHKIPIYSIAQMEYIPNYKIKEMYFI